MTDKSHNERIAHEELQELVQRIERLTEEKKLAMEEHNEGIKDLYTLAASKGYDKKTVREAIRLRAMDAEARARLHLYTDVLGVFG